MPARLRRRLDVRLVDLLVRDGLDPTPALHRTTLIALGTALVVACTAGPATAPAPSTISFRVVPLALDDSAFVPAPCLIFDDLDGDLDPDILLMPEGPTIEAVLVLENDGGTFSLRRVDIPILHGPLGCSSGDLSQDGLPDLYLAGRGEALVLRNLGGLAFEDVTSTVGVTSQPDEVSLVSGFSDLDADGDLDLYIGRYAANFGCFYECAASGHDLTCRAPVGGELDPSPNVLYLNEEGRRLVPQSATGLEDPATANAVAFFDWDQDGLSEVVVANDFGENRLFRNLGGLRFTDEAGRFGVGGYNHGMGVAFADFNRDGVDDLYVADLGSDQLWRGTAQGPLIDAAGAWNIREPTRWHSGWAPLAVDFDHDGWTDLFVASSAVVDSREALLEISEACTPPTETFDQYDLVFHNDGQGSFRSFSLPRPGRALIAGAVSATADFDGDGDLDIAEIYSGPQRFRLLENTSEKAGHFLKVRLRGHQGNLRGIGATVTARGGGETFRQQAQSARGSLGISSPVVHFGLGPIEAIDRVEVLWPGGARTTVEGPLEVDRTITVVHAE